MLVYILNRGKKLKKFSYEERKCLDVLIRENKFLKKWNVPS